MVNQTSDVVVVDSLEESGIVFIYAILEQMITFFRSSNVGTDT